MKRYRLVSQSHSKSILDIGELIRGHRYNEIDMDISAILSKKDVLEVLKNIDTTMYDESYIELDGEYFIITSTIDKTSAFFVENVFIKDLVTLKTHETDILILADYLPQFIKNHFLSDCDCYKCIELVSVPLYEKSLLEIIED